MREGAVKTLKGVACSQGRKGGLPGGGVSAGGWAGREEACVEAQRRGADRTNDGRGGAESERRVGGDAAKLFIVNHCC